MQNKNIFYTLGVIVFFSFFFFFFLSAPSSFPTETMFTIERGWNLRDISLKLKNEHIIRSRLAFEAFIIMYGGEKHIISSDYFFEDKLPVFEVARRILKGERNIAPVTVTIPEGFSTAEIADVIVPKLVNFNKSNFLKEAEGLEGYLFPDTYFFLSTDDETDVLKSMGANFKKKIALIRSDIAAFGKTAGKTEREIIIMASIIEGERKSDADQEFISGILWKRIAIGIPLQADAAPETYKNKGLPKNPINNPGLDTLKAAIHPRSSPYLYYLHDKNGNIHYARTFSEHIRNKFKYLK